MKQNMIIRNVNKWKKKTVALNIRIDEATAKKLDLLKKNSNLTKSKIITNLINSNEVKIIPCAKEAVIEMVKIHQVINNELDNFNDSFKIRMLKEQIKCRLNTIENKIYDALRGDK